MASEDVDAESRYEKSDSDEGWFQDVAANLDTYVQLSIAGQYNRASWYFDDLLNTPDAEFPVVAQHADTLIDQGSFGEAEELLLTYRASHPPVRPGDEERHLILDLLLANTQMYTKCDTERAARTVTKALQMVGRVLIDDATPPGKLQIAVISLRIVDLLLRMPHDRSVPAIDFELPFTTASEGERNLSWHEVLISMLAIGYVWEAQTLLPICLRHVKPEDGTAPLNILNAIPKEDDTIYTLVRCTMLVEVAEFFASQSWPIFKKMEVYKKWREMVDGGLDPSCPMDNMLTPISRSRAYQEMELFHLKEKTQAHKSSSPRQAENADPLDGTQDLQKIRAEAEKCEDYMLLLATYEQSDDLLPYDWLERTGTSQEALECLHPNVQVSSHLRIQRQIVEQKITYADDENSNVRGVHYGSVSPDLAISDGRESFQNVLGPGVLELVIGGVALTSLFDTCMNTFERIDAGKNCGRDYQKAAVKIVLLGNRLQRWQEVYSKSLPASTAQEGYLAQAALESINSSLGRLCKTTERYQYSQSPKGIASVTERLQILRIGKVKTSVGVKIIWALHDQKEVNKTILSVRTKIEELEKLTLSLLPTFNQAVAQRAKAEAEELNLPDSIEEPETTIPALEAAAAEVDPCFSEATHDQRNDVPAISIGGGHSFENTKKTEDARAAYGNIGNVPGGPDQSHKNDKSLGSSKGVEGKISRGSFDILMR